MNLVAVLVGGLVGTGLRLGADALLPHAARDFPWSTLIVNVAGSFALGLLVARVWPGAPEWLRAGLGPGVLGAFTTFSAVVGSALTMTMASQLPLALLYLGVSVIAGLGAAWAGLRLGARRPPVEPVVDQ